MDAFTEKTPGNAAVLEKVCSPLSGMVLASRASGCFFGHPNP